MGQETSGVRSEFVGEWKRVSGLTIVLLIVLVMTECIGEVYMNRTVLSFKLNLIHRVFLV